MALKYDYNTFNYFPESLISIFNKNFVWLLAAWRWQNSQYSTAKCQRPHLLLKEESTGKKLQQSQCIYTTPDSTVKTSTSASARKVLAQIAAMSIAWATVSNGTMRALAKI